jgi:hypothetical protein
VSIEVGLAAGPWPRGGRPARWSRPSRGAVAEIANSVGDGICAKWRSPQRRGSVGGEPQTVGVWKAAGARTLAWCRTACPQGHDAHTPAEVPSFTPDGNRRTNIGLLAKPHSGLLNDAELARDDRGLRNSPPGCLLLTGPPCVSSWGWWPD